MGKVRRSTLIGLTLLLASVAGCKVSCTTANISSLKFSKDKEGKVQAKEFAPADTIYARADISNNPGDVTLQFSVFAESVEGVAENAPLHSESVKVPGDGYGTYTLEPTAGWRAGRYRVDVAMMYNGEQKDKKSDTFTVKGGSGGVSVPSPDAPQSPAGEAAPAEDNENADDSENSGPQGER
jgi:hypothetical protein